MLDTLFDLFKTEKIMKMKCVLDMLESFEALFEDDHSDDKASYNASIDAVIKLFEANKRQ